MAEGSLYLISLFLSKCIDDHPITAADDQRNASRAFFFYGLFQRTYYYEIGAEAERLFLFGVASLNFAHSISLDIIQTLFNFKKISTMSSAIYWQRSQPEETSEFLTAKYAELEDELSKIPTAQKQGWISATEKCPSLVSVESGHRLMFLRCEVFNVKEAAERICKYWDKRIELFGDVLAYKPLHVGGENGALHENSENTPQDANMVKFTWKGLYLGFMRPTLTSDTGGRALIFADPSAFKGYNHNADERYGVARSIWYVLHNLLEGNDTVQKLGVVVIAYPHHTKISYVDRKLMKMNME